MATVSRRIAALPAEVFAVVSDPATYPDWLVGAQEMRAIDDDWPAPGSKFHHRVGLVGPLTIDDSSSSVSIDPPRCLELEVRARPAGRGSVVMRLVESDGGTVISFEERPLGMLAPLEPLIAPLTRARNRRSLDQLAELIEDSTPAA